MLIKSQAANKTSCLFALTHKGNSEIFLFYSYEDHSSRLYVKELTIFQRIHFLLHSNQILIRFPCFSSFVNNFLRQEFHTLLFNSFVNCRTAIYTIKHPHHYAVDFLIKMKNT